MNEVLVRLRALVRNADYQDRAHVAVVEAAASEAQDVDPRVALHFSIRANMWDRIGAPWQEDVTARARAYLRWRRAAPAGAKFLPII